jgi:hypothetical protein
VEQPDIDDRVERSTEPRQLERVHRQELGGDARLDGGGRGPLDRRVGDVDPDHGMAARGEQQAVPPGAAADVEDAPRDQATLREPNDGSLGATDLPAGDALVGPLEDVHSGCALQAGRQGAGAANRSRWT